MKILVVQDTDWIKKGPHQQHHLLERLSTRGHKVLVIDHEIMWKMEGKRELFSKRSIFTNVDKVKKDTGIVVVRPAILKIPLLDYVSMLYTYNKELSLQIDEFKPDWIASGEILSTYLALNAARKNQIPFLYFEIDITHRLVPYKFLQPIARIMEKYILKNSNIIITINEKLRDYAINMGATPEKTYLIPAGVDFETYRLDITGDKIRKEYGICESDMVLFYMGWLYGFSGLKEVLNDFVKLKECKRKNIKFLIVGTGDAFSELNEIVIKNNMGKNIILTGQQPYHRIPEFISASNICLLPAYNNEIMRDIVPIKLYEYMAMAKPVISTRLLGVVKEFGEENGIIYVNGPSDVLDKAISIFENKESTNIGIKARKFVEKYDWENFVDNFEQILLHSTW